MLDAEVKIGELMAATPKAQGTRTDIEPRDTAVTKLKTEALKQAAFTGSDEKSVGGRPSKTNPTDGDSKAKNQYTRSMEIFPQTDFCAHDAEFRNKTRTDMQHTDTAVGKYEVIDKVGVAQEVRKQKLKEGQEIGEAVLDAEVRIGELMREVPKAKNQYESALATDGQSKTKTEAVAKMMGMDAATDKNKVEHMIKRFETLAAHPEIVAQAKAEAKENDDIVTRSLVLNMVKLKSGKEHGRTWATLCRIQHEVGTSWQKWQV